MSDAAQLHRECHTFARLLSGRDANDYVTAKYVEAHAATTALGYSSAFDERLTRIASRSPLLARLADAYARHVAPRSALRKKLVLVLAILEVTPPYAHDVTGITARPLLLTAAGLAWNGFVAAMLVVVALPLFGTLQLLTRNGAARP